MTTDLAQKYRHDIDGLRAISVLSVYFFHCGFLPNGYLGVDVFFAISGYLLTRILYQSTNDKKLNLLEFYVRRIRRILPLSILASGVALATGYAVMLPDDLENLAQSVIATQLFSNNILLAITTRNYWDISNDYKPLMHTWSLGVEEQFYMLYPLLFLFFARTSLRYALPTIATLTAGSLIANFSQNQSSAAQFFYLPYRFWEISAGGLIAIIAVQNRQILSNSRLKTAALGLLALTLFTDLIPASANLKRLIAISSSLILLAPPSPSPLGSGWAVYLLSLKTPRFIGKISYSLYMWHQVFLAYSRYTVTQSFSLSFSLCTLAILIIISYLSFVLVEEPFRNPQKTSRVFALTTICATCVILSSAALYIVSVSGIVRDVPELEVSARNTIPNQHIQYNERINSLDQSFEGNGKVKVLVVGDSFARDWCNVLLESAFKDHVDLTYAYSQETGWNFTQRVLEADVVFLATKSAPTPSYEQKLGIPIDKLWIVGTKNFGYNSGLFYNYRGYDFLEQRTKVRESVVDLNNRCKAIYGNRYIDLIGLLIKPDGTVRVFTPEGKFISQDTVHLTRAGAEFIGRLLHQKLDAILTR